MWLSVQNVGHGDYTVGNRRGHKPKAACKWRRLVAKYGVARSDNPFSGKNHQRVVQRRVETLNALITGELHSIAPGFDYPVRTVIILRRIVLNEQSKIRALRLTRKPVQEHSYAAIIHEPVTGHREIFLNVRKNDGPAASEMSVRSPAF